MKAKKLLAMLLALCMLLGTMSFTAFAEEPDLTISTADELQNFAASVNAGENYEGKTVVLADDIDMNYTAVVIGTSANPFKGTFDGQGHIVSNISIYENGSDSDYFADSDDCLGLFGVINTPAVIKNVTVDNPYIVGRSYVGAIVGKAYTGKIENCHVTGEIDIEGNYMVGGITGHGYAKISDCSVIGKEGWDYNTIMATYLASDLEGDNVGGIVGHNAETNSITNCSVKNVLVSGTRKVGGIVGITAQNGDIINCSVENVTVETTATAEYAADNAKTMSIGGIIGQYQSAGNNDGEVTGCTVSGLTFSNQNDVPVSAGAISGGLRGSSTSTVLPADTIITSNNSVENVTGSTVTYLEPAVVLTVETVNGTVTTEPITGDTISYVLGRLEIANNIYALAGGISKVEITLNKDVVETDTILIKYNTILNLNGKTVTYNSTTQGEAMITNKGTLTINDSVGTGVINYNYTGAADNSYSKGNYTISNAGTLTVNGGKITIANLSGHAKYPIDNNSTTGDAILVINGGHLYNYNTSAIRQFCNSETNKNSVTINGGLVEGYCAIWVQNPGSKTVNGTLAITDGEIKSTAKAWVNGTSELKDVASRIYCTIDGNGGAWSDDSAVSITGGTINENVALAENAPTSIIVSENADCNGYVEIPTLVVAKIGENGYASLAEALAAAQSMTGDVTVEIYNKVTLNQSLAGSYSSIKFVGKADAAEIYLEVEGYITATGKTVAFEDLKLSKSAGGYITNAGFMNLAFGVYDVPTVSYKNCTFVNGAYASSGVNTFTGCTFYRSHDRYGLWAYGDVNAVVDSCTFADIRGIKMYDEGGAKTTNLTVKNTNFAAVTDKPAIVLTYGESVTLENNTYSSTGVFELDLDGAPNGTPVESDVSVTCKNDNGACGVLVDGKIYTTVEQAAAVATEGSKVTLLHDSTETVEFAEGVILDKNNYTADYVTVKKPASVAKIGDNTYTTIADALAAAQAGDEIVLLADVEGGINVPADVTFNGNGFAVNGTFYALGDITFAGHTKIAKFDFENVGTEINIGAGACLEVTDTANRMVIGHGCTFNIEGNIVDAKTANVAELTPSLIMPGASFTGAGVTFNVKNAYIKTTASYCSSSKSASGTFDFNIENSIWEQFGKLAFESQSTAATVNFELKDSVLTTGSHLVFGVSKGEIVIDNSNVNVGTSKQIENQSTMTIKNGSVVNGAVATSSNAKNPGTIIVEDATYAVTGEFSGSDLGTGTIIVNKDATFSAGSITKANITIDATGMTAGEVTMITANLSKFAGTFSVINNNALEAKIVDGKIVLANKPVAKIGDVEYTSLQAAIDAAANDDTIELLADIEMTDSIVISDKTLTLDLGEYTIYDKNTVVLTSTDNNWGLIALKDNANLTVCGDGTIDCNYNAVTATSWTGMAYCFDVDETSELTVNGGFFTNGNGGIQTAGKVTVNNGTFVSHNGGTCIMATGSSAYVTVNDGIFKDSVEDDDVYTGSGAVWSGFGATVKINGGSYDFAADPEHNNIVWTLFPAQNAISGYGENANMTVSGGTFVNFNPATDVAIDWSASTGFTFGSVVAEGYTAIAELTNGNYVVGETPTATVNNLGAMTIPAGEYYVYDGSLSTGNVDMPLNFVMQFVADQDAEDMTTSPYADWYADFVITFEGIENESFDPAGCYLAGYYGSTDSWDGMWVKIPVDGLLSSIDEGTRYPVMMGVGMPQTYDYICSGVQAFSCAMFIPENILKDNPNLKVNLELNVVDSSDDGKALEALQTGNNIYKASETTYTAKDFAAPVAKIGDVTYTSLQEALDAAVAGTGNVTVEIISDIDLSGVDWNPVTVSGPGYPMVTVNGNDHVITGLNDMLFASTWAGKSGLVINELTIKDSNIEHDVEDSPGNIGVGAFIGYPQASAVITLNDCHLVDSTVNGGHWTGGLIGMAGGYNGNDGPVFMNLTITGCSVTGSTVTGKGSAGGVMGHGSCAAWTNVVIENTTVSGNTITSTGSSTNKAGAVMGTIGAAGQETTVNGETKTGGASVSAIVSDNTVTSNGTAITTIYGRQGTETGKLVISGGTYEYYPIEENVAYASPAEGYVITQNADGTYGVTVKDEAGMLDKLLVISNMNKITKNDVTYYPIHLYAGIDTLQYQEVGFDVKIKNTETGEEITRTLSTTTVYESMNVKRSNGTTKTYEASALKGNYMFGKELLFTVTNWSNDNTVIYITPYAKNFDDSFIYGETKEISDSTIKEKDETSALFKEAN